MPLEPLAELPACYLGTSTAVEPHCGILPKRYNLETWLQKYQWDGIMFNV